MAAHRPTPLGALLIALRKRRRVSQGTLARQSGVSRAIISILERGYDPSTRKAPHPRPDTLRQVAHGLAQDGDGQEEPGRAQAYYTDLMRAAGYGAIESVDLPRVDEELRGVRPDPPDREDGAEPDEDTFHAELARRYGAENAEFVDEFGRQIKTFPDCEASFLRNMLMGAVYGGRSPWRTTARGPDGGGEIAKLVRA